MMGRILMPPKPIRYPHPKAVGEGHTTAKIVGRVMEIERYDKWGDYTRIMDLVEWRDGKRELRFCQFYRKAGGNETDWIYGQGAGHMTLDTFYKLIAKAKTNPDYGSFEGVFDRIKLM